MRDHHTSMIIETTSGPYLYVFGGTDAWTTIHDDIQRARIAEDGSLGAFEQVGKLPYPRAGHCMVRSGNRLYLIGGAVTDARNGPSKTSVILELDADGKIVGSVAGPDLAQPVLHLTCDVAGEWIYAAGGCDSRGLSTRLSAPAHIGEDGTLSAFENQAPLDPARSHHASFTKDGRLYLLGGISGDPTAKYVDRKDVVYAPIAADGTLGSWTAAGSLPLALSVSSAQLYKDAVYILGGLEEGTTFSRKLRRATFEDGGVLGPFTALTTMLPRPRGHVHHTPMWKGKDQMERSLGAIDIGRFQ